MTRTRWVWGVSIMIMVLALAYVANRSLTGRVRLDREANEVVLAMELGLEDETRRITEDLKAQKPGLAIKIIPAPSQKARELLVSGQADLGFYRTGPNDIEPKGIHVESVFFDHWIIGQWYLDPPIALTSAQAWDIIGGKIADWSELGGVKVKLEISVKPSEPEPGRLAILKLSDLKPGWVPIPIDGIVPGSDTVFGGSYPLTGRIILARRLDNPRWGDPWLVKWFEPNRQAVMAIGTWAEAAQTRFNFYQVEPSATLAVVGDVMLARGVQEKIDELGVDYPFAFVADRLKSADVAFANLESPVGTSGRPLKSKQIWLRAKPGSAVALRLAGIDAVTVANNHILDYDTENFLETLDVLSRDEIKFVGGGRTLEEARKPLIIEAKGVRMAFLSYSEFANIAYSRSSPRRFAATDTIPGVAPLDEAMFAEDIKKARQAADVVVVSPHWGVEYQNYPTQEQKRLARLMVDAGADLVLGHHPHAIQGFEFYKGKFIGYSLGNFVFDQREPLTVESMILEFKVSRDGVKEIRVTPVGIEEFRPRILGGEAGDSLRSKIREISRGLEGRK